MDTTAIREGMTVYSADGKKLGEIIRRDDDALIVEKGLFFKKDYSFGADDVDRVEGDEVWLRLDHEALEGEREEEISDRQARSRAPAQPEEEGISASPDGQPENVVVIVEEQVTIIGEPGDEDPNRRQ